MMLASIVLPRPTASARMARPLMWRSTRWATSTWCGSALIAFASRVISRSKPGTRAIRSASRRSSCQARSVGGAWSRFANASRECSSTDQTSSAGGVGRGRTVGDSGIDTQRVARGPQYTSYQLSVISCQFSSFAPTTRRIGASLVAERQLLAETSPLANAACDPKRPLGGGMTGQQGTVYDAAAQSCELGTGKAGRNSGRASDAWLTDY